MKDWGLAPLPVPYCRNFEVDLSQTEPTYESIDRLARTQFIVI
jgi:hypothetical protein